MKWRNGGTVLSGQASRSTRRAALCVLACLFVLTTDAAAAAQAAQYNNEGLKRLSEKDYEGAVKAFEAALQEKAGDPTLRTNLVTALNAWGVALGEAGRTVEAAERLSEAFKMAPDNESIRRNLFVVRSNWAVALSKEGQFDRAEELFVKAKETAGESEAAAIDHQRAINFVLASRELAPKSQESRAKDLLQKAVALDPKNVAALVDLGTLLYNEGDSEAALTCWKQAVALDPNIPGLNERIAKVAKELETEGNFLERSNRSFTVSYEGEAREDAAREVLHTLSQAYADLGHALQYYPRQRLAVVIYTREQYANVTLAPHWSGAIFDGKIRVPLPSGNLNDERKRKLREMLYHEYVHALVHDLAGTVEAPSWFNEGLATYYELDKDARENRYYRERLAVKALAASGILPSIGELPPLFTSIADPAEAERAYMIARTFTTWLAKRHNAGKFPAVLRALGGGATMEEAIEKAYGRSLDKIQEEWRRGL